MSMDDFEFFNQKKVNKVCTCNIEDNEEFVNKIVKIGEKFMAKHNI